MTFGSIEMDILVEPMSTGGAEAKAPTQKKCQVRVSAENQMDTHTYHPSKPAVTNCGTKLNAGLKGMLFTTHNLPFNCRAGDKTGGVVVQDIYGQSFRLGGIPRTSLVGQ
jgi:hypothetical protein